MEQMEKTEAENHLTGTKKNHTKNPREIRFRNSYLFKKKNVAL